MMALFPLFGSGVKRAMEKNAKETALAITVVDIRKVLEQLGIPGHKCPLEELARGG